MLLPICSLHQKTENNSSVVGRIWILHSPWYTNSKVIFDADKIEFGILKQIFHIRINGTLRNAPEKSFHFIFLDSKYVPCINLRELIQNVSILSRLIKTSMKIPSMGQEPLSAAKNE